MSTDAKVISLDAALNVAGSRSTSEPEAYVPGSILRDMLQDDSARSPAKKQAPVTLNIADQLFSQTSHSGQVNPPHECGSFNEDGDGSDCASTKCSSGSSPVSSDKAASSSVSSVDTAGRETESLLQDESTTLMIRNLPIRLTKSDVISELDRAGFTGHYDVVYLPLVFTTGKSQGFAFVNFTSDAAAQHLRQSWHGSRSFFSMSSTEQPLNIALAAVQGRELNLKSYRTRKVCRIRNPRFRPFVA